ncbi:DUF1178 family protein [Pseudomonadota bacterium]
MITYTLICDKDHEFAETFDGYDDCQTKLKAKALACPTCGSKKLVKGLSAPSVGGQAAAPAPTCPSAAMCGNGGCPAKG